MALSEDLVAQFVDVTKENDKKSKESITYGTIKEKDGKTYVLLDGATEEYLTPVYTTTNVQVDERVTVMIKNHTATVTGNMSSPAARTAEVEELDAIIANTVDTVELKADRAEIGTLIAEDATIKNLQAENAEIKNLKADKAEIEELYAKKATVEELYATKATVEELYATKAEIGDLTADVAKIDTLMFGSASGNTIQTEFSNSVVAQLGDAQIKDAMIQEVSAGKITAGNIVTNHVNVMSEDGSLVIADETIQISDDNRVRVQIGKDATNDYSINIWDANGNLMFSEGGITDSAIKKAIIRNDMVSDNANISAGKLDINSLFEEINGSTNTLKSSKIFFDDKGQTLDVAFKAITDTTDGLSETISSQGTQLEVVQGKIADKIWEQDIKTELDNVKIGGRNLVLQSDTEQNFSSGIIMYTLSDYGKTSLIKDQVLTISFDARANSASEIDCYIRGNSVMESTASNNLSLTTSPKRYSCTLIMTGMDPLTCAFRFKSGGTCYVSNVKVELGNKATDWTPAPEDVDSAINGAVTEMTTKYSTLEQTVDGIRTTVASHTTDLANKADSSKVSSLEQSLDGFKTTVSETYATQDALSAAESAFEQKADEITATVSSIQIGGRNLVLTSSDTKTLKDGVILYNISDYGKSQLPIGQKVTISFNAYADSNTAIDTYVRDSGGMASESSGPIAISKTLKRYYCTVAMTGDNPLTCTFRATTIVNGYVSTNIYISNVKLELGNKATDWTPAPEDTDNAIGEVSSKVTQTATEIRAEFADAGKTATNYIQASAKGLMVADNTKNTLGNNVLIDSDSVDIRNGETVSSSFADKKIELGKDSKEAVVDFCNGSASISATDEDGSFYDGIAMDARKIRLSADRTNTNGWSGVNLRSAQTVTDGRAYAQMFSRIENQGSWIHTTAYGGESSGAVATGIEMHADKYNNPGWETNYLKITPHGTYLNDIIASSGNEGLIRPWNKVLHDSSAFQMYENQTVTLKEAISDQPTGIVLVFREIKDGALQNSGLHTYFVPKLLVQEAPNYGHSISWAHYNGNHFVCKYLYINDTTIKGNEYNDDSGTTMSPSGITVTNNKVVLWRVYGV